MSYFVTPGLRFNDCVFSEPVRLEGWVPPSCAGLAVFLVGDPHWAPKPFRPLLFGEFGNDTHRALECLRVPSGAGFGNLYVSALPMPFSTSAQRRALRNELISAYNPLCQAGGAASAGELAQRLNAIETRQQEQNAQILHLLSTISRWFEPPAVAPRRPVGFVPPVSPAEAPGSTENESSR